MAEEDLSPAQEAQRIVREYLSKRSWARGRRRTVSTQLYSTAQREELEAKQRQCDSLEEEAEEAFDREIERWRKNPSSQAKEVLRTVYELLYQRNDLGFFAQRIISRLK